MDINIEIVEEAIWDGFTAFDETVYPIGDGYELTYLGWKASVWDVGFSLKTSDGVELGTWTLNSYAESIGELLEDGQLICKSIAQDILQAIDKNEEANNERQKVCKD